ncbi:MAG TPA: hypothetical protein DD733_06220 [Clostridiales bacterium]|nr:hypothetical protein [Clostridiales bacterium]
MKKSIIVLVVIFICLFCIPVGAQIAVSVGKAYELVTPASSAYPDTSANKLTDGIFALPNTDTSDNPQSYYQRPEYVGFNQTAADTNGNFVIILDLGEGITDLTGFEISYLNQTDIGIFSPESVTFSVSDVRNDGYAAVGTATIDDSTMAGVTEMKKVSVTPSGVISGRYVKAEIKIRKNIADEGGGTFNAGWVFLDEITVSGNADTSSGGISETNSSTDNSMPQTGDGIVLLAYAILAITAICIIGLIISKRKLEENK